MLVARGGRGGNPWASKNGCGRLSLPTDIEATRLVLLVFDAEDLGVADPVDPDEIQPLSSLLLVVQGIVEAASS